MRGMWLRVRLFAAMAAAAMLGTAASQALATDPEPVELPTIPGLDIGGLIDAFLTEYGTHLATLVGIAFIMIVVGLVVAKVRKYAGKA